MQSTETDQKTRPDSNALRDLFAIALQGDVYACTRVWEAWQVGTMTEDDFTPAWENEGVLGNLVEAATVAFTTALAAESDRADRYLNLSAELQQRIVDAEHPYWCQQAQSHGKPCTCWKSEATA